METSTRKEALRAAAKVAFSMTVVACGQMVNSSPPSDQAHAPSASAPSNVIAPSPSVTAAPSATAAKTAPMATASGPIAGHDPAAPPAARVCGEPPKGTPTEKYERCCETVVASAVQVGAPRNVDLHSPPEVVSCCAAVIGFYEELRKTKQIPTVSSEPKGTPHLLSFEQRTACCVYLPDTRGAGSVGQPTCSPWGPPVPPDMPGEALTRQSRGPASFSRRPSGRSHPEPPSSCGDRCCG